MMWVVSIVLFLVVLGGIAVAEDLSKINSYAVTFGVTSSATEDLAKINAYVVVVPSAAPIGGSRGFGSLSLGIN